MYFFRDDGRSITFQCSITEGVIMKRKRYHRIGFRPDKIRFYVFDLLIL